MTKPCPTRRAAQAAYNVTANTINATVNCMMSGDAKVTVKSDGQGGLTIDVVSAAIATGVVRGSYQTSSARERTYRGRV